MTSGRSDVSSSLPPVVRAELARRLDALRAVVLDCLTQGPAWVDALTVGPTPLAAQPGAQSGAQSGSLPGVLLSQSVVGAGEGRRVRGAATGPGPGSGAGVAASDAVDAAERDRLIGLVELARRGDKDAFGLLYDHYHAAVFRFVYYRTRSTTLTEDLTSDTFFRALRSMNGFRWQGKDFGAWLMTIARNLVADHYKASRTRLEHTTDDPGGHHPTAQDGTAVEPEDAALASLSHGALLVALGKLPADQQECLVMRFLEGFTIAETAAALRRSEGAVKQLQLRAVRTLAKLLPEGVTEA